MGGELSKIGEYAIRCWEHRDRAVEKRLDDTAHMLSRAVAAVDASGQFPRLADALDEAVRQLELGSVALLMNVTPLAADAARRILEVVFFTIFLKDDPQKLASWHAGAQEFRFTGRLKAFYDASPPAVANGPFGLAMTDSLYRTLSASVHANPTIWNESRDGLKLAAPLPTLAAREEMLHDAVRSVMYVLLYVLPDLEIDDVESVFPAHWPSVKGALGI